MTHGVEKLGIFGSVARGEEKSDSDIDILIYFRPEQKKFNSFMQVYDFLESQLGKKVDLITPESLSPFLKEKAEKEAVYERFS